MTRPTLKPAAHPFAGQDISSLLNQQARRRAEQIFLIWEPFESERQEWTYSEFSEATKRLASGISKRGIGAGDFVLIHMENCPEYLLTWFACARLGAIAVTTNTRSAADELRYYADFSGVKAAITQPKFAKFIKENCSNIEWMAVTDMDTESSAPQVINDGLAFSSLFSDDELVERTPDPTSPLCVMYTSGTTSRPKGVVWTHANGLWAGKSGAYIEELTPSDVHHVLLPLFHMNALSASILPSLWVGASVVLQPKFSASRYWDVALRNKCTWGSMVPFVVRALMKQEVPEHYFKVWAPGVNGVFDKFFNVRCVGWWGMTETVSVGIVGSIYHDDEDFTIGRPSPFYSIAILSSDGSPVQAGESGELRIRGIPGVSLFDHYLNNPEVTESSFDEAGYFITGDRVRLNEDGSISFQDRLKDMLKVGGENVSAAEVERVIRSVPGVSEVAVVAKSDTMLNEVPVAFVLVPQGTKSDGLITEINAACEKMLADFKRPHEIKIVSSLPRATLGKVAKAKLRNQLEANKS